MSDISDQWAGAGPCTPGDAEWLRRLDIAMSDPGPTLWWWLSFVDTEQEYRAEDDYPGGPRFLGVCIVPAPNFVFAGQVAWALGCNPGGQVSFYPAVPDGWTPKPEFVGRLFRGDAGRRLGERDLSEWAVPS